MTPEHAEQIVRAAVAEGFAIQGITNVAVTTDTVIYGPTSELDSLGYISTTIAIEDALYEEGLTVHLDGDDFDPAERYATVATMRDYLVSAA
jgi:acyl carrier protein